MEIPAEVMVEPAAEGEAVVMILIPLRVETVHSVVAVAEADGHPVETAAPMVAVAEGEPKNLLLAEQEGHTVEEEERDLHQEMWLQV